jgi:hypothetical protein
MDAGRLPATVKRISRRVGAGPTAVFASAILAFVPVGCGEEARQAPPGPVQATFTPITPPSRDRCVADLVTVDQRTPADAAAGCAKAASAAWFHVRITSPFDHAVRMMCQVTARDEEGRVLWAEWVDLGEHRRFAAHTSAAFDRFVFLIGPWRFASPTGISGYAGQCGAVPSP